MVRKIVKQPNGKYAMWSSVIDDFLYIDLTEEEYIAIRAKEEHDDKYKELSKVFEGLKKGDKYYIQQYTKDYEWCVRLIKEIQG